MLTAITDTPISTSSTWHIICKCEWSYSCKI